MWFPQRWVPDIPSMLWVPVLSGGWSCLAQGLGRAWEVPWESEHPGCSVPLGRVCPSVSCDSSDHGSPEAQGADVYCPLVWLDHSLSWVWGIPIIHHGLRLWAGKENMRRNVFWFPASSYQGYK